MRGEFVRDLLLLRRKFHVVAVSGGKIFNITVHGFVRLAFKENVYAARNAGAGDAPLDFRPHFGKVTHIFRLRMTGSEFVEESSYFPR